MTIYFCAKESAADSSNNKQMYFVQKAVKETDPEAFIIVLESNEVHGDGFEMLKIGESGA